MGVSLWGDLPSPKATARQEVPCTITCGVHVNEYYQKYEPKASRSIPRIGRRLREERSEGSPAGTEPRRVMKRCPLALALVQLVVSTVERESFLAKAR
jgi:hypothetical protein